MFEGLNCIETPLLKVPFETLKREARERKGLVEEISKITQDISNAAEAKHADRESAAQALLELRRRLVNVSQKHEQTAQVETASAARCLTRVQHLDAIARTDNSIGWNRKRLPRILVDHLLREGHWETAHLLARETGCEDLVDLDVFRDAQMVVQSLRAHDCSVALRWCEENAARLRKLKSKLQFRLRVQEFIELVRRDQILAALCYAREHLAPWAATDLPDVQRVLALLVFRANTTCARYKCLLEEQQWAELGQLFLQDLYRISNMPRLSVLEVHLQAGLTALKSPLSYEEGCTREDPVPHLRELANQLPWAKHVTSKLVCALTKSIMNDSNPPMVLPNGYVYSRQGLDEIAAKHGGKVTCVVTGFECKRSECVQAYIL